MSADSPIEWTDATWNPVRGCSRVSEGCRNCYAEAVAARFSGPGLAYEGLATRKLRVIDGDTERLEPRWTGEVRFVHKKLAEPLHWAHPFRVFVNSMSDLFHEKVTNEQVAAVFGVMAAAHRHTFQVLTKRASRMSEWFEWFSSNHSHGPSSLLAYTACLGGPVFHSGYQHVHEQGSWPLPNVWLGVSAENQQTADERIPLLLQTPAAVRFVSAEPLLGPIDFRQAWVRELDGTNWEGTPATWRDTMLRESAKSGVKWVIVGGESGQRARECDIEWIRDIVRQCRETGTPCFVKQLGANPLLHELDDEHARVVLRKRKKANDPAEWPVDLRVRQFPEACP